MSDGNFVFFSRSNLPRPKTTTKPFISMMSETAYLSSALVRRIEEKGPLTFGWCKERNQIAFMHRSDGYIKKKKSRCLWSSLKVLGVQVNMKLELMEDVPGYDYVANLPPRASGPPRASNK